MLPVCARLQSGVPASDLRGCEWGREIGQVRCPNAGAGGPVPCPGAPLGARWVVVFLTRRRGWSPHAAEPHMDAAARP